MSALAATPGAEPRPAGRRVPWRRAAPTLLAGAFALAYLIISPPSEDLAAHLLRAQLFRTVGFGLWNNWWYAGHSTPGYSVLFPPLAAVLTPQAVGAASAVATAALFESLARRHFGPSAWLGALWFGAATAVDLYTGRLTFAFGLMLAMACALALQRRRDGLAALLAVLTPLGSPVAALFAALAAVTAALARARAASAATPDGPRASAARAALAPLLIAGATLAPVLVLAWLFPEGGSEPYARSTLWPILLTVAVAVVALPRRELPLRVGILLFGLGNLAAYVLVTPVGSNASRLEPLLAGPIAAILWWPGHRRLLLALTLPLLYIQIQAPIRDVSTAWHDEATESHYYQPLLAFLARQGGPPFRIEIPFTLFHWEAYEVAPRFPLARGWERQVDIADNPIFYGDRLDPATYAQWLHENAVRFVAVAQTRLDYSAHREAAVIAQGLPYLQLVMHTRQWRVYAVRGAVPIVTGAASLVRLGANSLTLRAVRAGTATVRVHFSPYWALSGVRGCVAPDGDFMRVTLRSGGTAHLQMDFSLGRAGARSPRCT